MVNSTEFISLINARCSVAITASTEYKENEKELDKVLGNIDPKTAMQIDELIARQQTLVEELVYRQGIKDTMILLHN